MKALTLYLLLVSTWITAGAQLLLGQATIQGRIFDQAGKPASSADVSFMNLDHDDVKQSRRTTSNQDVEYTITVPAPGSVRLYVYREASSIPNTRGLIFESGKEVYKEMSVINGDVFQNVDLKLPAPNGTISIAVLDATTHLPIPNGATLIISRLEKPEIYLRASNGGAFRYALPNRPFTLTIEASATRNGPM